MEVQRIRVPEPTLSGHYTTADAAEILGIHTATLIVAAQDGKLHPIPVKSRGQGGGYLWPVSEINKWHNAHAHQPARRLSLNTIGAYRPAPWVKFNLKRVPAYRVLMTEEEERTRSVRNFDRREWARKKRKQLQKNGGIS